MSEKSDGTTSPGVDWNASAAAFDEEPDHGLRDPDVRAAWAGRLRDWLPERGCDLLDLGCGTGSLSLLAAEQGHRVTGVDLAPAMIDLARAKLAGRDAAFLVGDAAAPPVGEERFDALLVRHVLWTLPDPARVLRHWRGLLRPGGRLVLVEGVWGTVAPVGIPADRLTALLAPLADQVRVERLSQDARLWGGPVTDERYAVVAMVRRPDGPLTPAATPGRRRRG
ncbi:class I SAM-dependent methyltransferase [Streptomyces sp. B21-097]|uniref:class I SAM-dependent methyltransferase n=1 Tax=Streptomyces TaxID=1883 RepID=UPI002FEFA86D